MQIDEDSKNKENLIAKGMHPVSSRACLPTAGKHLAERLRTKQVHDGSVFLWLLLCFGILALAALVSALI